MRPEIEDLVRWYQGRAGTRTALRLATAIAPLIHRGGTTRLLALGYCAPLLSGFDPASVERLVLACPADQGASAWPGPARNLSIEVEELALPFTDALFDQALVVHSLEHASPPVRLLRELWRVLAPGGSVVIVAPNRTGLWVHFETTPFGHGTPFGKSQIETLLADTLFQIDHRQTLLAMPPLGILHWPDRALIRLLPKMGGLQIIRAHKIDGPAMMPIGRVGKARRRQFAAPSGGAVAHRDKPW